MRVRGKYLDSKAAEPLSQLLLTGVLPGITRFSVSHLVCHGTRPRHLTKRTVPSMDCHLGGELPIKPALAIVLKGGLFTAIGQRFFYAQEGDWLVFSPGVPHHEFCLPSGKSHRILWFQFPENKSQIVETNYSRRKGVQIDVYATHRQPSVETMKGIDDLLGNPRQPAATYQKRLLRLLSWWLEVLDDNSTKVVLHTHPLVNTISAMLDDPSSSRLSVTQLASATGFCFSYVSKLYHRQTGQTLRSALQKKRIERAQHYLAKSSKSLKEIASLLGFSSAQHFNHAFHRFAGESPSQFRLRLRQNSDNQCQIRAIDACAASGG